MPHSAGFWGGAGHNAVPDEILWQVRHTVARLDNALQSLRRARDDSRIVAGRGVGTVCRESFVERRSRSGVTVEAIREDRATLAEFVALAAENGVDGAAVVREVWQALKAERGANPSGRYFDCRRVERERQAARLAALAPLPVFGFPLRERRHGYDVRHRGIVPDPYTLTPAEYRRRLARILRAQHTAKVATWRAAQAREAVRAQLRARGKQTPERESLAKEIRMARAGANLRLGVASRGMIPTATQEQIRRHYLEAKRRRRDPIAKTAARLAERAQEYRWFIGVEVEGDTLVLVVSNPRQAAKAMSGRDTFEGKRVVVRKAIRERIQR